MRGSLADSYAREARGLIPQYKKPMKIHQLLILSATLLALPACEKKSVPEKVNDGVDDALDRRPAEKVQDAAEDAKDAVKDAGREVKDAVK